MKHADRQNFSHYPFQTLNADQDIEGVNDYEGGEEEE
jgi:hypothetical protein